MPFVPQVDESEILGYTIVRAGDKAIITKDGEILAEKEIKAAQHYERFCQKFRRDKQYRESLIGAKK